MPAIAASVAFSEAVLDEKYLSAIGTRRVMWGSNSNNCAITFGHIDFLPLHSSADAFRRVEYPSYLSRRLGLLQADSRLGLHFESSTSSELGLRTRRPCRHRMIRVPMVRSRIAVTSPCDQRQYMHHV